VIFLWLRDNLFIDDPEGIYERDGVRKRLAFDSITIPKAVHHDEVVLTSRILRAIEHYNGVELGTIKMGFLIEDPTSGLATYAFASADPTTITENFGVADYTASTGGRPVAQRMYNASLNARKRTVVASHAAKTKEKPFGVDSQEAITLTTDKGDSLRESNQAINAGMRGKWSINPSQADGIELAPWVFHETGMTRKPLGNWTDFELFPMDELERLARDEIPFVKRKAATPKAVQPQRASIIVQASDIDTIEQAVKMPLDQLTLDVQSLVEEEKANDPELKSQPSLQFLLGFLQSDTLAEKTRLALRIDAQNLITGTSHSFRSFDGSFFRQ